MSRNSGHENYVARHDLVGSPVARTRINAGSLRDLPTFTRLTNPSPSMSYPLMPVRLAA